MKTLFITAVVAACASSRVLAQDMGAIPDLGALLGGSGEIDMGKLEELGQQLEEASKNCDTEKLGVLAEACGQSIGAQMKSCTGECKELFKFMGEEGGCGDLYDQFGLGDIEELCNGADIGDIVADVPVITTGVDDSGTDMPSPDSTPDSATTTTVPSKPDIISETTSGSMAGVVVATSVAILAIV